MKKSNIITLIFLCLASVAALAIAPCLNNETPAEEIQLEVPTTASDITEEPVAEPVEETTELPTEVSTEETTIEETEQPEPPPMASLFVGDSRTVGLMEYSGMEDTSFFCCVGMSVFNVHSQYLYVSGVGMTTLKDLLATQKYGKVYVMLGLNELGYSLGSIVNTYGGLLELIETSQPRATILIQANLHVTYNRSLSDGVINNPAIDRLNEELSNFADGERIIYMDANPYFDDENGSLPAKMTGDNVHLYAKYYAQWGQWIIDETKAALEQADTATNGDFSAVCFHG